MGDQKTEPLSCRNTDVANQYESITILTLLVVELMILAFIVYRMLVLRKYQVPKSVLIYVYGLMIVWALTYTAEYSTQLLAYHFTSEVNLYQNYPHWFIHVVPRFNVFLDLLAPIIIHTLLLIVPYFWIRNILFFLEHSESIQKKGSKIFNKVSRFYMIISRALIIPAMFMVFFIPISWIDEYDQVIRMIIIVEALLIVSYLIAGYKILKKNFQEFAQVSDRESFKIKMQSGCLIFICLLRCIQNLVVYVISTRSKWDKKLSLRRWIPGLCKQQASNYYYMIDLIIGIILMHFVPIITILYIYKPEHQEQQNNQVGNYESLMSSTL